MTFSFAMCHKCQWACLAEACVTHQWQRQSGAYSRFILMHLHWVCSRPDLFHHTHQQKSWGGRFQSSAGKSSRHYGLCGPAAVWCRTLSSETANECVVFAVCQGLVCFWSQPLLTPKQKEKFKLYFRFNTVWLLSCAMKLVLTLFTIWRRLPGCKVTNVWFEDFTTTAWVHHFVFWTGMRLVSEPEQEGDG